MRIDLRRGEKFVNLLCSFARGASMGRTVKHHHIPLSKPCEIEDFTRPDLLMTMRRVHSHEVKRCGASWPRGMEHRKLWEVAMAILAMQRYGVLRDDAIILGVGVGLEPTTFYLTNFVRWVFATDLYVGVDKWQGDAPVTMPTDPEAPLVARLSKTGVHSRLLRGTGLAANVRRMSRSATEKGERHG